jgi:4-aminobutyrate aminotransferase
VIGFERAFHGRTYLSLALTSKTRPYKEGLGPFAPEVYRVPFNDVDAIRGAFKTLVAAEDVAAIVFEPVQGEGGFFPATKEFVEGVRAICDEHGIVMVCDEVQSGFARTGRFFAIEHFGVTPDLITVAKSIAMGIPLSGVLGKAAIMDAPEEGGVGGTYVGNPVAQAAAVAVLDVIEEEGLVERSAAIGETIRARMLAWQGRWPAIRDVRGLGSMLAIELDDADVASAVVQAALERGLLLLKAGVTGNAIRVLVPLVIADAELDEALDAWEQALETTL